MIYTVTFNPAIDYIVRMDSPLDPGMTNRSASEDCFFGGKGINVSEQRTKELIEQFSQEMPKPEGEIPAFEDVARWPELAEVWLKSL